MHWAARLTGSANLEKANKWTAEKMKAYGLENVRLEPWEIPYGWERGRAEMKLIEPDTGRSLLIASRGWTTGTKGKVTGDVVLVKARKKEELEPYKGKLKNAVVLLSAPSKVAPITDLSYLGTPAKKDDPKKEEPKSEPKKEEPKKDPSKNDDPSNDVGGWIVAAGTRPSPRVRVQRGTPRVPEGRGSGVRGQRFGQTPRATRHHGQLGPRRPRRGRERPPARVHGARTLHVAVTGWRRLPKKEPTRVEVEITNKFVPGPITVYNTIGEVRGSEKPDEIVVVDARAPGLRVGTRQRPRPTTAPVAAWFWKRRGRSRRWRRPVRPPSGPSGSAYSRAKSRGCGGRASTWRSTRTICPSTPWRWFTTPAPERFSGSACRAARPSCR